MWLLVVFHMARAAKVAKRNCVPQGQRAKVQCDIVRRSELASGAVHVMYEGCFLAILAAEEANLEELGLMMAGIARRADGTVNKRIEPSVHNT
jgi:hypothetical protein